MNALAYLAKLFCKIWPRKISALFFLICVNLLGIILYIITILLGIILVGVFLLGIILPSVILLGIILASSFL
jgi:hypothetical protein